jgi:hypothetical protein
MPTLPTRFLYTQGAKWVKRESSRMVVIPGCAFIARTGKLKCPNCTQEKSPESSLNVPLIRLFAQCFARGVPMVAQARVTSTRIVW